MVEIAKTVQINPTNDTLIVDGEEFPWYIEEGGCSVSYELGSMPVVTLRMFAESVEVDTKPQVTP